MRAAARIAKYWMDWYCWWGCHGLWNQLPWKYICSVAKCPRGVGEKLEIWCCHTVRVDEVGRTIPCGQEVGPPRDVRLYLDAQAELVVEALDSCAEGN